jgi:hypothetical protein
MSGLLPGWEAVPDPNGGGGFYYWNKVRFVLRVPPVLRCHAGRQALPQRKRANAVEGYKKCSVHAAREAMPLRPIACPFAFAADHERDELGKAGPAYRGAAAPERGPV